MAVQTSDKSREQIFQILREDHEAWCPDAYVAGLIDKILASTDRNVLAPAVASAALGRIIREERIPLRPKAKAALDAAWAQNPTLLRVEGHDREVLELAKKKGLNFFDPGALSVCIQLLAQKEKYPIPLNEEATAQKRLEDFRKCLIQNISRGKPAYSAWDKRYGQFRNFNTSELYSMNLESLKEIDRIVAANRAIKTGQDAKPIADEAEEGATASVPAQKEVGYMGKDDTDEFLAHPSDPSREYTPSEIRQDIKNLLFIKGQSRGPARRNAINRILAGKKFGA